MFAKIWRGESPLWVAFWIYAVLPVFMLEALFSTSAIHVLADHLPIWVINSFLPLLLAYLVFVSVGIWRASAAYRGPLVWAISAKLFATVWVLGYVYVWWSARQAFQFFLAA